MTTSRHPIVNVLAIGLLAAMGVTACSSQPNAKRVAQDLVKTETADQPKVQDCMLKVIDDFDKQYGLDKLGGDVNSSNTDTSKAAQKTLDEFEAELAACR